MIKCTLHLMILTIKLVPQNQKLYTMPIEIALLMYEYREIISSRLNENQIGQNSD
jgi:hypothetical protein